MSDYSLIDLHTHTIHSREGGCDDTVETVLEEAQKIAERSGKDALIAITDHNTISGVQEALAILRSGKYPNVKVLPGCEFTVTMDEINQSFGGGKIFGNCHILAYGFDPYDPGLTEFSKKRGGVNGGRMGFSKLVEMVESAGGHLVIAHPGLIKVFPKSLANYHGTEYSEEIKGIAERGKSKAILRYIPNGEYLLELFLKKLIQKSGGLVKGMERFHPDNYSYDFDKQIAKLCEKYGLAQTAGSDFHGYHLHTEFSVGNPFTERFQEYYKEAIQDSNEYRNGLHISHLPGLEVLMNKAPSNDKEIRMITAQGEPVTFDQYNQVLDAFAEENKRRRIY